MIKKFFISVMICVFFVPFSFSEVERHIISEDLIIISEMYENCSNKQEALEYLELVRQNTPYNFYAKRKIDYLVCEIFKNDNRNCCLPQQ